MSRGLHGLDEKSGNGDLRSAPKLKIAACKRRKLSFRQKNCNNLITRFQFQEIYILKEENYDSCSHHCLVEITKKQ
jgi:hypothetical protein